MKSYLPASCPATIVVNVAGTSSSLTPRYFARAASSDGTSDCQLPFADRNVSGGSIAMPTFITPELLIFWRMSPCARFGPAPAVAAATRTAMQNAARAGTRRRCLITHHLRVESAVPAEGREPLA